MVLREVTLLALGGALAGSVLAAAGAGGLRGILYEVEPHDAATYAGVILLLMLASGAAACLPAWRAVRIDPAQLLR
jgi:ABC-type antimicrobial peptide transport system permease subunit